MEETTGAPSSFAGYEPRRPRASSRDGGGVVNRSPSTLTMLLSRHTRRREFITLLGGAAWLAARARAQEAGRLIVWVLAAPSRDAPINVAFFNELRRRGSLKAKTSRSSIAHMGYTLI